MNKEEFIRKYAVERKHTNSAKWDGLAEQFGKKDLLPLWVADTEFAIPQAAQDALIARVKQGAFGYSFIPQSYYNAYFDWQKRRYGTELHEDWMRFGIGVVNTLSTLVRAMTQSEDAVMVLQPVYYPFMKVIENNQRRLVVSYLVEKDGEFYMDFDDIKAKMEANNVKLLVFCSPHNPVGRVWKPEELSQLLQLCREEQVMVISDEIHHDLIVGKQPFVSALSIDGGRYRDNIVMVDSPSKTFNMAALLGNNIVIPNPQLRARYDKQVQELSLPEATVMATTAGEAAYRTGDEWLENMLAVIRSNYEYVKKTLENVSPKIKVTDLQGTYLLWVDLSELVPPEKLDYFMVEKAGLAVDMGDWFGKAGRGHIRLNLATTPKIIYRAMQMLTKALKQTIK